MCMCVCVQRQACFPSGACPLPSEGMDRFSDSHKTNLLCRCAWQKNASPFFLSGLALDLLTADGMSQTSLSIGAADWFWRNNWRRTVQFICNRQNFTVAMLFIINKAFVLFVGSRPIVSVVHNIGQYTSRTQESMMILNRRQHKK